MKNTSNNVYQRINFFSSPDHDQEHELLSTVAPEEMFMEDSVAPPAYMWDRIEQALNKQDERFATATNIIMSSFKGSKDLPVC